MTAPYLSGLKPVDQAGLRAAERSALGFCLGSHPCEGVAAAAGVVSLRDALASDGEDVTVCAVVRHRLEKRTKRGDWMGVLWLEDDRDRCEAVCFSRAWATACEACEVGVDEVVLLKARCSDGKLVVSGARPMSGVETVGQGRARRLRDLAYDLGDFVAMDIETCLSAEMPPAALETATGGARGGRGSGGRAAKGGAGKGPPSAKPMTDAQKADLGWQWRQRVVELACVFYQRVDPWWVGGRVGDPGGPPEWREWRRVCRRVRPAGAVADMQTHVHGISEADVRDLPTLRERAAKLAQVLRGRTIVTYNGRAFDLPVLRRELARCDEALGHGADVDVKEYTARRYLGRATRPDSMKLGDQARYWGVDLGKAHSAEDDAAATGKVLINMVLDACNGAV